MAVARPSGACVRGKQAEDAPDLGLRARAGLLVRWRVILEASE
jgi:hypothetical protein